MKTFPEINGMNRRDVTEAIKLGRMNYDSVKPEFQADLRDRLEAMEERLRRLDATDVQIKATVAAARKPKVKLTGTNGNVFALAGLVTKALRRNGQSELAHEFTGKLMACGSYDEALCLMINYVEVA